MVSRQQVHWMYCNIMAEGLGWEHFGSVHGLLRCNINIGVHASTQSGRVTQRCHNSPRWETGLQIANDVTHQKHAEDFRNLKKVRRVETKHRTRRLAFASSRGLVAGAAWDGGADEKARIERLCLSLLISKNLSIQR